MKKALVGILMLETSFTIIPGDSRLCEFIGILNERIYHLRHLSATVPSRLSKSLQEHKGVLEALKKGDKDLAEQRLFNVTY